MHLLIILLQQLLGMLPGSKKVPQPEVVRKGSATPNAGEPDACGRIAPSLCGWMTPFAGFLCVAARPLAPAAVQRSSIAPSSMAGLSSQRASRAPLRARPSAASRRRPRR